MNRAFFLDRDGTVNEEISFLHRPEDAVLIPGVAEAIRKIHAAGFLAVVVSNQSGVARGMFPPSDVEAVHARIQWLLLRQGADATADAWYYCPHHPEITGECGCRKPRPGMLLRAAEDLGIDLKRSFMVGDRMSDLRAGAAAGCAASLLVTTGYGAKLTEDARAEGFGVAPDLTAAVGILLGE